MIEDQEEISLASLQKYNWGRILALLSRITEPVSELAPVLLEFIGIDLRVDRLGLYVSRTSGNQTDFVMVGLHGGLGADKKDFGEIAEIKFNLDNGLIQYSPTSGVGWDVILLITPMGHEGKIKPEDVLAILALDDTSTERRFTDEHKGLISVIHWALREFFTQREIIAAFRDRDPLTGLLNKRALYAKCAEIDEKRKRLRRKGDGLFSLAFLDLDHFKEINGVYGEPFGDKALREFTHALKEAFRVYDIVARVGGEEFVVIIDDLGEVLEKRLKALLEMSQHMLVKHKGLKHIGLPFSAGIVNIDDEESVEDAIERAAKLKQQAKEKRSTILTD